MHMPPSQQAIPFACHAAASMGAQSITTASRHTHALNLLPGAIGTWSECRIGRTRLRYHNLRLAIEELADAISPSQLLTQA
jgi:hypothetical protein